MEAKHGKKQKTQLFVASKYVIMFTANLPPFISSINDANVDVENDDDSNFM